MYKMLRKYYKFNTQSTMSIKSHFIWNICFKCKYFRNICMRIVQLFPRVLCFQFICTDQYLDSRYIWENISQIIELVMLYNYKRNSNTLLRKIFRNILLMRAFQLSNRRCYPCHFQQWESWRQLHPRGFWSSYWIALQSPLAISQNACNHFPYVALHVLSLRFKLLTGWKIISSLWSLSKGSSIHASPDQS